MGKLLSLGTRLKYPIIINKLLKRPGDDVKKEEAILQYKFTWTEMVGDPLTFGEQWEKTRTTIADWDSPADGKIAQWRIQEGMSIDRDMVFVEIEESCPHSVQFAGLCGMCGKDMTEMSWSSREADTDRAKINMIHDQTFLTVSESEASKAEEELQRRLLKHKKLSLVVDLDQTIIHACIEPTVGEWQRDVNSPNYEAVKDVRSFQLNDDGGPRGIASGCWYYIKMRPGLKEFLAHISELYELHVYTMGTRAYAVEIAKIVDPDKKLFGERIISRDENGNVTAKSLARLFPVDTKMVVIIDDRADVWPKNRPNLIKVVPYDFFLGIGDINSSFLPKREDIPKASVTDKKRTIQKIEAKESESTGLPTLPAIETFASTEATDSGLGKEIGTNDLDSKAENKVSALEELVSMGGGNDQALRLEQAAEQEKFLEKQLTERPLLHLQEELDKKDNEEVGDVAEEVSNGDTSHEQAHHRHNLLRDDDVELEYLEKHLTQLHKAFYEEYDSALKSAQGGRIAQLKPGHNKKVPIKENAADLKIVPDIGQVMPRLKAKTLAGTTIVLSGLVPLGVDIKRSEIGLQAMSFGANIQTKVTKKVTHVVASTNRTRTAKVRQAAKYPHIKIVDQRWLLNSMSKWEKEDEEPYLVQIHQEDRRKGDALDVPSSMEEETDDDNDGSGSSSEDADNEDNAISASQEESDDEGVMPANMEGGVSPIDNLQGFDWDNVDDELAEFLGSDTENESDTGSVASDTSHGSNNSTPGRKRKHEEATDDDDSDTGTAVIRKRKRANDRGTGLKTVKTPNSGDSESSLPTPGVTGDENDEDATDQPHDDGDELDDDDLEAELEAAFEAEAQEAALNSAVDGHDGGG